MPYTVLQAMTDHLFPRQCQYYWKACLMNHISDDAIDTMLEYFSGVPSPHTVMGFQQLGNTGQPRWPGRNRLQPPGGAIRLLDAVRLGERRREATWWWTR